MKISVIIPVYNEEAVIGSCLSSLAKQTVKSMEIIVVDDGSTDGTTGIITDCRLQTADLELFKQEHKGPGAARNLGASKAKGEILVFVDADMEFEPDFIEKLAMPVIGRCIGTFSKEEFLLNRSSSYARCWNLNLGRSADKMHRFDYPDTQPVFRAILKSEFEKAGGFDTSIGYTDDWTLFRKLGKEAVAAPGAKYYHRNPETLEEVWKQARWFGKNEFLTKNFIRKVYNLLRYFPLAAPVKGIFGALIFKESSFIVFKTVYDTAVFVSIVMSFFGEAKSK